MTALTVNGQPVEFLLPLEMPLLWALRDAANLTGTKYGCGTGACGSCMVLIDGEALRACLVTLAEAEGRAVTTVEGLGVDGTHPAQQALVAEQAIQCGFCTPGMVMALAALLARNPSPGEADVRAALPNLCRCGVYPRLVRAAARAAGGRLAPAAPPPTVPGSAEEATGVEAEAADPPVF